MALALLPIVAGATVAAGLARWYYNDVDETPAAAAPDTELKEIIVEQVKPMMPPETVGCFGHVIDELRNLKCDSDGYVRPKRAAHMPRQRDLPIDQAVRVGIENKFAVLANYAASEETSL